jgi:predicted metal-binding membrane protein
LSAIAAATTIAWCTSMSAMGQMAMPGGWTMTMAFTRMPGQTWMATAASFIGMWVVMMVAMMLPSLVPMLARYRSGVAATGETRVGCADRTRRRRILLRLDHVRRGGVSSGRRSRGARNAAAGAGARVPIAIGAVVLIAGGLQFTAWKTRQLACCRDGRTRDGVLRCDAATAWRHGVRLGLDCGPCCANLMILLLVIGVMDLRAMAAVTAAITLERLAPAGARAAHAIGAVVVACGLVLLARAL